MISSSLSMSVSTSNDSSNWYRKVSVRLGMFGENVGRSRVVNFINRFKTVDEVMKNSL